jgi:membrane fusion protein (multidrug efflux system)
MRLLKTVIKALLVAALLAALLGVPVLYALGRPELRAVSIEQIHAREGVPVEVTTPVLAEATSYSYCDGSVVAYERALLRAKVAEIVQAVHVRVGEPVEQGQVLIEMRTADLDAEVQAAQAAALEAENNYARYAKLAEQGVVSADRLEQARTRRDAAASQLRSAESRLKYARLASPIGGIVEMRCVEPGEYAGVGDELLSVVDLRTVEVAALVPEQDMAHVAVGMEAQFQREADAQWHEAAVSRVSPSTTDPNRFFDVFLKVDNPRTDGGWLLLPGMYVEVRFARSGSGRARPAVPDSALVLEGTAEAVYVVAESTAQVTVDNPGTASTAEQEAGVRARLSRGLAKVGALLPRRPGPDEAPSEAPRREATVLRARRLVVHQDVRERDLVWLAGDPVSPGDRVIVNPRDAIRDGTVVQIAAGGGEP